MFMKQIIFVLNTWALMMSIVYGQSRQPLPEPCTRNIESVQQFIFNYQNGGVDIGEEGDLGKLINRDLDSIKGVRKQCERKKCPLIVIIDTSINPHPEFSTTIEGGQVTGPSFKSRNANKQDITIRENSGSAHFEHGTYMAGIVASQENCFGLLGINPSARLKSLNWEEYLANPIDFARDLAEIWKDEYKNKRLIPIFVMATSWKVAAQLSTPQARDENPLVHVFEDPNYLFVVAAGQAEKGSPGNQISNLYTDAPMNLGDKENVIVVTAYAETDPQPALLPEANYSYPKQGMVQVAAPGDNILSTGSTRDGEIRYVYGHGTSPATAIVAGVVSLMISKYPEYFRRPAEIKERLQIVSSPIGVGASNRIAAGVINAPSLALRNPEKDLVKGTGESDYVELSEFQGWGTDRINVWNDKHTLITKTIPTRDIYRIYQAPNDKWIIYTQSTDEDCIGGNCNGQIKKWDPARLSVPTACDPKPGIEEVQKTNEQKAEDKKGCSEGPLFFALDNRGQAQKFYLASFDDLILHNTTTLGYSFSSGH